MMVQWIQRAIDYIQAWTSDVDIKDIKKSPTTNHLKFYLKFLQKIHEDILLLLLIFWQGVLCVDRMLWFLFFIKNKF